MNQITRKLMTMHKALHPREDINRLYESRKEGGRGRGSSKDCVDASIQRFENYLNQSKERLIITANCSSGNISRDRK